MFRLELIIYPTSVSVLYGVLGFILYIFTNNFRRKFVLHCHSNFPSYIKYVKLGLPILIVALISGLLNPSTDYYFIKFFFSIILTYFSAYIIAFLFFQVYNEVSFERIVTYIVICTYIYFLLAIINFVIPSLGSMFLSLMKLEEGTAEAIERVINYRLVAFGVSFFNGGVVIGFINLLIALYVSFLEKNIKRQSVYILSLLIFAILGLFIARTSMIGSGLAFIVLFFFFFNKHKKVLLSVIICFVAIFFVLFNFFSSIMREYEEMFNWAFELFISYKESGQASASSLNFMLAMYDIVPNNLKTWIIGDALWLNPSGTGYYMNTDIGLLRYIWYFGIVGLLIMIVFNIHYLKLIFNFKKLGKNSKYFIVFFFIYVVILLFKGAADLLYLSSFFFFCSSVFSKK